MVVIFQFHRFLFSMLQDKFAVFKIRQNFTSWAILANKAQSARWIFN